MYIQIEKFIFKLKLNKKKKKKKTRKEKKKKVMNNIKLANEI
jgi:hypothetical protein